jgi:hypothetical protein
MTTRTAPVGSLLFGVTVAATFRPALERTLEALRRSHPKASDSQLLDLLFLRGLILTHDALPIGREAQLARHDGVPA